MKKCFNENRLTKLQKITYWKKMVNLKLEVPRGKRIEVLGMNKYN